MGTDSLDDTAIEGLPRGTTLASREIAALAARGGYRLVATPGRRPGVMELRVHPDAGGVPYETRTRANSTRYRDHARTTLETWDPGTEISMTLAMPYPDLDARPDASDLPPGTLFRGMRHEEFEAIRDAGEVWSNREFNMGGQEAMTCWATDPFTAASYACSFAPVHCKPTFGRPAWVVAVLEQPDPVRVPGMGSNEVGCGTPVPAADIVAAWRGDVTDWDPGSIDILKCEDGTWTVGGMRMPGATVAWTRLESNELNLALGLDSRAVRVP